jgi:hypothetical protein
MFIEERGDELWLGAAVPRYWLKDGALIGIHDGATYFGPMSVSLESHVADGYILMTIDPPQRNPPRLIRARFRHPEGRRMLRCTVNEEAYDRFDPDQDWVELTEVSEPVKIVAEYR